MMRMGEGLHSARCVEPDIIARALRVPLEPKSGILKEVLANGVFLKLSATRNEHLFDLVCILKQVYRLHLLLPDRPGSAILGDEQIQSSDAQFLSVVIDEVALEVQAGVLLIVIVVPVIHHAEGSMLLLYLGMNNRTRHEDGPELVVGDGLEITRHAPLMGGDLQLKGRPDPSKEQHKLLEGLGVSALLEARNTYFLKLFPVVEQRVVGSFDLNIVDIYRVGWVISNHVFQQLASLRVLAASRVTRGGLDPLPRWVEKAVLTVAGG